MKKASSLVSIFFSLPFLLAAADTLEVPEAEHFHAFLWAQYNQHKKDNPAIVEDCYDLLLHDKTNAAALEKISEGYLWHLSQTEQYPKIISLIPELPATLKPSYDMQIIFAQAQEKLGNHKEAQAIISKLAHDYPTNPEAVYNAATALARTGHYEEAISSIDTYIAQTIDTSKTFLFNFLKGQIYTQLQLFDAAKKEFAKSTEANPHFEQAWIALGLINEQQGNIAQALAAYKEGLHQVGSNPLLERQILALEFQQKSVSNQNHKELLAQAMTLLKEKKYQQALETIQQCLALQKDETSKLLHVEILCHRGTAHEGITTLVAYALEEPTHEIWYKAFNILYQAGAPISALIQGLNVLEQKNPTALLPILYQAHFYQQNNDLAAFKSYLEKALALTHDALLKAKILYQQGLLAYQQKARTAARQLFQQGYELNAEYPPLLNALAYCYAKEKINLPQAAKLIDTALQNDPYNPRFLDTKAMVWYVSGDQHKAYQLLLRIAPYNQKDPHLFKHLFKIAHNLGNNQFAAMMLEEVIAQTPNQKKTTYQRMLANL